ncbi:MAG: hypothetical protein U0V49_02620 [Saprospiraceae bacterium]
MRGIIICILVLLIQAFGDASAQTEKFQRNGMVEFIRSEGQVITVSTKHYAKTKNILKYYCERNAMENILFRGIPNSNQTSPMMEGANELDARLAELLETDYIQFITNSQCVESTKSKKFYYATQIVSVDLQALRKYLEDKKIIRKFGL